MSNNTPAAGATPVENTQSTTTTTNTNTTDTTTTNATSNSNNGRGNGAGPTRDRDRRQSAFVDNKDFKGLNEEVKVVLGLRNERMSRLG